jgi:hypothetical protein
MDIERKTDTLSIYKDMHTKNMQKECPGSIYERSKYISVMILEKDRDASFFFLKDIIYVCIEDAYKKYIEMEILTYPEPYQNLPVIYPQILKERILSQMNLSSVNHLLDLKECFLKFAEGKEEKSERILLDNKMHFDDHLIDWKLPSDLNLREAAENIVKKSDSGSWLIRRSSVKEQDDIKIRVITLNQNGVIKNFLFAHINGFGYVLTDGTRGHSMPRVGDGKTIKIQMPFYSLPAALMYLNKEGLCLSNIIV